MAKSQSKAISTRTALSIISAVVFLALLVFLILTQVNFLIGRSLLIAFGNADSSYKGAWFELDGDLVAKDFVLASDEEGSSLLTFKRVHVETPGWSWVIGHIFSEKNLVADIPSLHVTLTGGTSAEGIDPTLGDLGPFGTDAASPFEAEGCMKDNMWLRSELVGMGLAPGPTTLEYEYTVVGDQLSTSIVLTTPGVSRVDLVRRETVPAGAHPFLLDQMESLTTFERWTVHDQGFVKARNAHCAKLDGIDAGQFVQRHVDSVKRLLATRGVAMDAASAALYTRFATNGGELSFGGDYLIPVPSNLFYEVRERGLGAGMVAMNGVLAHADQRVPVQLTRFKPQPLPGLDAGVPTYAALVKEGGAPVTVASVQAASAPLASAALAPAAVVPTALAASGRPLASSLPQAGPAPVARFERGAPVAWSELPLHVGSELEIYTGRSPPRIVTLNEAGPTEIRVEGSVAGGHVQYRINRDSFSRAVFIR